MIRSLLKFLVSRSLDDATPMPNWLETLVKRDAQAEKFSQQAHQLDALLRSSAATQRQAMAATAPATLTLPPHRTEDLPQQPSRTSSRKWLAIATAAVVLVAVSPALLRRPAPEVHAGDFSQQLTIVPGEVLRVLTQATETSRQRLPELSPLSRLKLPKLSGWENLAMTVETPVHREFGAWQSSWQKLKSQFPGSAQGETQEL